MPSFAWAAVLRHRLAWPLLTLFLLLAVNTAFNASFLHMEWRDGHLYGSLIDILNRAAPLVLVSLGMTLVIATRGIDISVGAVVAIAAAVAAWMIGGSVSGSVSRFPMPLAILAALGVALVCGLWNGLLVARIGMQPIIATLILMVAGRGIAQLITDGQIITIYYAPFFFLGGGYLLGLPFSLFIAAAVFAALYLAVTRTALGLFIQAVGINPTAARVAGVQARRLVIAAYAF
jgi:ribose/xylose/arabinose/galactoside ABC-type transport system permease subunit